MGSSITFPGRTCNDAIVAQVIVLGENPPERGDDSRIGVWSCRDATNWIIQLEEVDDSSEEMEESISSVTEEVWYWTVVVLSLVVLTLSIVVIVRTMRD